MAGSSGHRSPQPTNSASYLETSHLHQYQCLGQNHIFVQRPWRDHSVGVDFKPIIECKACKVSWRGCCGIDPSLSSFFGYLSIQRLDPDVSLCVPLLRIPSYFIWVVMYEYRKDFGSSIWRKLQPARAQYGVHSRQPR